MKQNIRNQITKTNKNKKKTSQLFNSFHSLTTIRIIRGLGFGNQDVTCAVDIRSQ
jgi:hypothetical protein